ncbi:MAG: LCP family protein [Clostridia bacterium]|nr:LCP family protein [Clostridia bacterium]
MGKDYLEEEAYREIVENLRKKEEGFEDISSNSNGFKLDTSKIDEAFDNGKHSYRRKKHGASGKFDDFKFKVYKWWKCMKKGKKTAIVSVVSVLLVIVTLCAVFGITPGRVWRIINDVNQDKKFSINSTETIDKDVVNIALFGIDSRATSGPGAFTGNSDSIMILSLNYKTNKIKLISVLRDSFVPMEINGKTTYKKINAAYALGGKDNGPETAVNTLNNVFGLDIKDYAAVNFYGMADIIDAVGGIDVELTKNEVTARGKNNNGINVMIEEVCAKMGLKSKDYIVTEWGKQHLNGIQAVAYSRIRYCRNIWGTSNDYGRTDRQRFVMEQLFNKVRNLSKTKYMKLADALLPYTKTSLDTKEIMSLGWNMLTKKPTFEQYRIPQTSSDTEKGGPDMNFLISPYPSGFGSIVYYDIGYAKKLVKGIVYDDMTLKEFVEKHPIEKNDWYKGGSSGSYTKSSSKATSSVASKTTSSAVTSSSAVSQNTQSETQSNTSSEVVSSETESEVVSSGTESSPTESSEVTEG